MFPEFLIQLTTPWYPCRARDIILNLHKLRELLIKLEGKIQAVSHSDVVYKEVQVLTLRMQQKNYYDGANILKAQLLFDPRVWALSSK